MQAVEVQLLVFGDEAGESMAVWQSGKSLFFVYRGTRWRFVCTKLLIMPLLTHLVGS